MKDVAIIGAGIAGVVTAARLQARGLSPCPAGWLRRVLPAQRLRFRLITTPYHCWASLARPFIGVATYAGAAYLGLWWLTPLILFLIFVAVVTVTHDVVHGCL